MTMGLSCAGWKLESAGRLASAARTLGDENTFCNVVILFVVFSGVFMTQLIYLFPA